jgi:RNA polymerase sigma-70 factor (ECF subfamily)
MYARGRQLWPDVELSLEVFEAHCSMVLDQDADPTSEDGAFLFLCCACGHRCPRAMEIVIREGQETARKAITRIQRDPDFVQDTLQVLWEKLLGGPAPKIAEYAARGPFRAWLKVAAVHTALEALRQRNAYARKAESLDSAFAAEALSPEVRVIRQRYAEPFQRALRSALSALPPADRQLLCMQVQQRCTIDDLARIYRRDRSTMARRLEKARGRVFELLYAEIARSHAGLTPKDLRHIAGALGSVLVLTLSEYGGTSGDEAPS